MGQRLGERDAALELAAPQALAERAATTAITTVLPRNASEVASMTGRRSA